MNRGLRQALCAFVLVAVGADVARAQSFTAGVRGAVLESDGVVPGVIVQLINEASNVTRETVSNAVGAYDFAAVPPGTYTVRAALAGFKTYERAGIRVATQQFITLDVQIERGACRKR